MLLPVRLSWAVAASLLFAPPAFAGGAAEFEASDGEHRNRVLLEFDGDKLRMTPVAEKGSAEASGYAIFRDGKMYSVAITKKQATVIEMGSMMKMMGSMMSQANQLDTGLDDIAQYHGLSATGKHESHAGISGEVYVIDYTTKAGKREKTEVVLAKNAKLAEMTTAVTAFSEMMAKAMGRNEDAPGAKALEAEFKGKNMGLLRVDQGMRLTRLDAATPASARFELPAAPMQMPALPEGMSMPAGGLGALFGQQAGAETDANGNVVTDTVGDKVERQKGRVKDRADEEVDKAADRGVDKVLDKAFDKIFGR